MASIGLYDGPLLLTAAACLPGGLVGMLIGHRVFRRIPSRSLEIFVGVFLLIVGAKLLVRP